MLAQIAWRRTVVIVLASAVASALAALVHAADIAFDIPGSIECREVSSNEFSQANPQLKQIEAKVRISAREIEGANSEIVQFDYEMRVGPGSRVVDYLPKTQLESSVAEDQIDITAANEDSQANGANASMLYNPLTIGGSRNTSAKKSESKHFKQLAAKDVVLASGTVGREHGVFFRVRPSRSAAFEGSREFTVVLAVPRAWRADVCQITCSAKLAKHSIRQVSTASMGGPSTQVGMYLTGDAEAAAVADELLRAQEQYQQRLTGNERKACFLEMISTGASNVFARGAAERKRSSIDEAGRSLDVVLERLRQMSGSAGSGE